MTAGATPQPVKMRADARQNRERLLQAADVVFQRQGINAPLDAVFAEAGVGKTTFFRHFPDRQTLLAALLDRATDELIQEVERIGDRPDALHRMMTFLTERIGRRAALIVYWSAVDADHPAVRTMFARSEPLFADAIARAKQAGLCRPDLTSKDMILIGRMLASAVNLAPPAHKSRIADRAALLLLEGYRTDW